MKKKAPMQKSIGTADLKHNKGTTKHGTHKKLGVPVAKPRMRKPKGK